MAQPNKKIHIDEQTIKLANLLKELFSEIEKMLHIKINKYAKDGELDDLYIKINLEKTMCFEVSLFNSKTNTMVIKPYDVLNLMTLCQLGMIDVAIDMDVKELYDRSKLKVYDEITEIRLD